MTKSAKNILVPVIENVIILGFLLVNISSKQYRAYTFEEKLTFSLYIHGK